MDESKCQEVRDKLLEVAHMLAEQNIPIDSFALIVHGKGKSYTVFGGHDNLGLLGAVSLCQHRICLAINETETIEADSSH